MAMQFGPEPEPELEPESGPELEPEQWIGAIEAVEIVEVPSVEYSTELFLLRSGLPARFRVDIPKAYNEAMLTYLRMKGRDFESYISSIVSSSSPGLDVVAIRYSEGSFFMTVVLGADSWIKSLIGTDYNPHALVGEDTRLRDALDQLNNDFREAVRAIAEEFKSFFQSDINP